MTKVTVYRTSDNGTLLSRIARALFFTTLGALPFFGLICFLEATRPAHISATLTALSPSQRHMAQLRGVARFEGVSAELGASAGSALTPHLFTARDAQRALADRQYANIQVGFHTEFVTKDRHRIALRIVSRAPIVDQAVPDNSRMMQVTPVSTANLVSFVWGQWLYRAEIEDKGFEPDIVVQKVL